MQSRINRAGRAALCLLVFGPFGAAAEAGPITFLTALPVAKSQAIIRGQYVLIRVGGDPTPAARELRVNGAPLAVAFGITPRLAIFGTVPILHKSLELDTPAGRVRRVASGLGDVTTFARYTVYALDTTESTVRLAPFGGIKLPTGQHDETDRLGTLPPPVQLGSGSWDGLAGVALTWQTKQWEFDAGLSYTKTTEASGFRFGDRLSTDMSFQYRLWPRTLGGGVPGFLFGVVESSLLLQDRNEIGDRRDPDSGGQRWDAGVGLQYVRTNYIIEGIIQFPVVDRPNGTGLRSDLQLAAGVRWNIPLPF
jgi:hypothetical protein